MENWKIEPKSSIVAKYIDCYWFLEKTHGDNTYGFPKLNPDPAGHLILTPQQQKFAYNLKPGTSTGMGNHLILPHSKTIIMDHRQPFLIFGIKFSVGAFYSLQFPTAQPTLDDVIPVDFKNLFQLSTYNQEMLVGKNAGNREECRNYCDTLLLPSLSRVHEDRHSELVRRALILLAAELPLSAMGDNLNCSQRTVERSFIRVTGFSLKQYHSMERLELLLEHVHKLDSKRIDWADTAFKFGFSDQPHLIRYLKSSLGTTPGRYAKTRDLAIDSYGNFE